MRARNLQRDGWLHICSTRGRVSQRNGSKFAPRLLHIAPRGLVILQHDGSEFAPRGAGSVLHKWQICLMRAPDMQEDGSFWQHDGFRDAALQFLQSEH